MDTSFTPLTDREAEILQHIAHGLRNYDIARTLGITTRSVERHLTHLFAKLHVPNRTAAVAIYWRLTPTSESVFRLYTVGAKACILSRIPH